jgi:hypothetical protein
MKRQITLALLIATLATSCAHPRVSDATYKRTSAELVTQLEALPGLTVDAHVESSFNAGQGNVFADVVVPVASTVAQINTVVDTVERTVWLSHLDPLSSISIDVTRRGGSVSVLQRLYQGDPSAPLAKYGPRPDGLD